MLESSSTIPARSRYVALNYCWGHHKQECLNFPATLNKRMERIQWSILPKTFQDAVNFTRSLGIRYLWIDSICIIQGDKNSVVTLGALYGLDSTAGLRLASNRYQSKLIAEVMLGQGRYPLYLRRHHYLSKLEHHDVSDDQVVKKRQPLLCRAWTYQEHMISPRVLYFSESEIIIQCFTDAACECEAAQNRTTRERDFTIGTPGKTGFFNKAINSNKYRRHASRQKNKDSNSKLDRHYISRVWRETIASQYSSFDLSFPTDRLPALAAIAEQFQTGRRKEKYLAGLWSGSLLEDLLWCCWEHEGKVLGRKKAFDRPSSLPTWSWASLQTGARIRYVTHREIMTLDPLPLPHSPKISRKYGRNCRG